MPYKTIPTARTRHGLDVTDGGVNGGAYVSAFVDERTGWDDPVALMSVLERLRRQLRADADVRLRAEWIDTGSRTVLLLTMGHPS